MGYFTVSTSIELEDLYESSELLKPSHPSHSLIAIISSRVGLVRTHAAWQVLLGIYLLFLAVTYAVRLGLAIAMARRGDAREEAAGELHDLSATLRKYRRPSLWILVPAGRASGRAPAAMK